MDNNDLPPSKITLEEELEQLKNNVAIGYLNGLILGVCWGIFYAPFESYQPNLNRKQFALRFMKYQGSSIMKLPPMSALVRGVGGYMDRQGYNQFTSMSIQLIVCFTYLTLVKFPK